MSVPDGAVLTDEPEMANPLYGIVFEIICGVVPAAPPKYSMVEPFSNIMDGLVLLSIAVVVDPANPSAFPTLNIPPFFTVKLPPGCI